MVCKRCGKTGNLIQLRDEYGNYISNLYKCTMCGTVISGENNARTNSTETVYRKTAE